MRDRTADIEARIRECQRYAGRNRRAARELRSLLDSSTVSIVLEVEGAFEITEALEQRHLNDARSFERRRRRWERVLGYHRALLRAQSAG